MTKRDRSAVDVSGLPKFAFGNRGLMWWGVIGFLAIEGTMLTICFVSYFYLRDRVLDWPPPPTPLPDLLVPTVGLALLLLSVVPTYLAAKAAKKLDARKTVLWLAVTDALGLAIIGVRVLAFYALNVSWDTNAYGSIVWVIIGMHTFHLVTEVFETIVITALLASGHTEPKYLVDATDNALYWYFIVGIWVPCYAIIFVAPRLL